MLLIVRIKSCNMVIMYHMSVTHLPKQGVSRQYGINSYILLVSKHISYKSIDRLNCFPNIVGINHRHSTSLNQFMLTVSHPNDFQSCKVRLKIHSPT